MKRLVISILLVFTFFTSSLFAQEVVSGVSKSGYINITKDPPKPPYLEIVPGSVSLVDENGNNKIDANEKSLIYFQLKNSGLGTGLNLNVVVIEENNIRGIVYNKRTNIGEEKVGQERQIQIPVSGSMDIVTGKALFKIYISEANGFDSDPVKIEIETKAFQAPLVKVVDYKVTSESSSTLQRRRPFDLQILIQNIGKGTANDITVNIPLPNGIYCLSGNENSLISKLNPGEEQLINYTLVTNSKYQSSTIPVKFNLNEQLGKYAENKTITLTINQGVSSEKLIVKGKQEQDVAITVGSLSSKVDKNIPFVNHTNPNYIALIIGNEDYSNTLNSEINVTYAKNDAETFRKYAVNMLGVEKDNVHFLPDATAGQMRREIDLVAAILKKLGSKGELIFYYAGHGFPDEVSKTPYLVPVDVDATNLSSAIKLADVYKAFSQTGAGRITLFLDACFSGGGRNQGLLAARGVSIKPKKENLAGNMVVFSASSNRQTSMAYDVQQHGMFTYFLLDKLQQTKGNVTYGQLADYLKTKVGLEALRINGKPQDPEVNVSYKVINEWKNWRFN
ncbi:MAG: hypothetical protein DRJ09_13240 [Bacteroidetes bacterium]|nr:MAG: hypothetical protein DRJ09_13240 [Bacteroidota bacterium]